MWLPSLAVLACEGPHAGPGQDMLTANGLKKLRTQVESAREQLEETKANKEATLKRLRELLDEDMLDMLMSKVEKKHSKKPGAGPPTKKVGIGIVQCLHGCHQGRSCSWAATSAAARS